MATMTIAERSREMRARFWVAVRNAGLSEAQFYKKFHKLKRARRGKSLGTSMFEQCFIDGPFDANTVALEWLIRACDLVDCDVRWVITGEISEAASSALATIAAQLNRLSSDDRERLVSSLNMTAEPRMRAGECCYCGCTDECGCGDCEWVDDAHTICSACLTLQE